ncbi:hypothetical protein IAT40_003237 [Kwoniella sp. CBS 6097]
MSNSTTDPNPVPIPPFLASILSNHLVPSPTSNLPLSSGPTYGPKSTQSSASHTAGPSTSDTSPSPSLFPATAQIHISDSIPSTNANANAGTSSSTSANPPPNALYLPPPALPKLEEDLVPPENFALVAPGVYRCGFPKKRNFGFMETLRLKTVLTLVLEDYPEANLEWCQSQDIQFMQFGIPGNKEPFDNIPEDVICSALVAIMDVRNHPVLIHCNKGKHRTGCLIGCIRRLQSWSLTSIFDEYRRFSSPKSRAVDQQFIDLFDIAPVWEQVTRPSRSNTNTNTNTNTNRDGAEAGGEGTQSRDGGRRSGGGGGGLENLPKWGMLTIPKRGSAFSNGGGVGSHLYAKYDRGCIKPLAIEKQDQSIIAKTPVGRDAGVGDDPGKRKAYGNIIDGETDEANGFGNVNGRLHDGVNISNGDDRIVGDQATISNSLKGLSIDG